MKLLFDQRKLPRTTTRKEWREIDRWRRVTQKEFRLAVLREEEEIRKMLTDFGGFGAAHIMHRRRPDPTGYVACDWDGSAIAGNIKIIHGFTEEEFKDAMIRLCQHKLRWRPI